MNLTIDGLNINYSVQGQGEKILILEGWGTNIAVYDGIAGTLSTKYEVITVDLPGFGLSDEPKEVWDVEGYVDFIIHFLEMIGCESVSLIGHSYGGRMIIRMVNRKRLSFKVKKLVLIDSAGIVHEKTLKQKIQIRKFKLMKKIASLKIINVFCSDALEKLKNKHGSEDYRNASPIMKQCLVKAVNDNLVQFLPMINYETLLIWGENDTATPIEDGKRMEELIPNAGLVLIKNAGHFSFLDQPYLVNRVLQSYFGI